jgi:hypothetical protein
MWRNLNINLFPENIPLISSREPLTTWFMDDIDGW